MAVTIIEVANEVRRLAQEGGFIGHVTRVISDRIILGWDIILWSRSCKSIERLVKTVDTRIPGF